MSIIITNPSEVYEPGLGFLPPITDGLLGSFVFGTSLDMSLVNHAGGGLAKVVGNNPSVGSNYMRGGSSAFLETDIDEPDEFTIVALSRLSTPGAAVIAGTRLNTSSGGIWLAYNGTSLMTLADTPTGAITASRTASPADTWRLAFSESQVEGGSVEAKINVFYPSYAETTSTGGTARRNSGRKIRIFNDYSTDLTGRIDISMLMIYDRYLNDPEIIAVRDSMLPIMAARSVVLGA